jgi:predicted MPP superfamily phosphohydrolase
MAAALVLGLAASSWTLAQLLVTRAEAGGPFAARPPALTGGPFPRFATAAVALAFATVTYGYVRGYRRLRVRRHVVAIPGLPPALEGLRLVHVSDLHLGPLADRAALREALDAIDALDPDLICVTGDTIDNRHTNLGRWLPELARLRARHGVFAILGNHDRVVGADAIAAALTRTSGWRVLRDEVAAVEAGGATLHLVGLEDRADDRSADGLDAALARVPADATVVLMVHHPAAFPAAAAAGVPLTLAGHTHAGQVAVPLLPRLNPARLLMTRYDAGPFVERGCALHVSAGLGTSGQRVRIGAPREIALLTLAGAGGAGRDMYPAWRTDDSDVRV